MYFKNEEEIFKILNSNIDGLDSKETEKRLKDYGQNIILNKKKKVWILRFLKQFNDTMIIIASLNCFRNLKIQGVFFLFRIIFCP